MTKRLTFATLFVLLFAATAFAADLPPGKWWRRPEIIQALSLNEEQQSKLEKIFESTAPDLIDFRGGVEKANIVLRTDLDAPALDRAAIRRDAARLSEARAHLFERELMMLVDMRNVLTDQQWTRMRAFLDRMNAQQPNPQRPNAQRPRQR